MQQKDIGVQISCARKKLNYTQRELADRLGVSDKTISKWERGGGYPDISMLLPLCKELGIELSQLLGEEAQPQETEEHRLKTFAEYAMMKMKENKQQIRRRCWIAIMLLSVIAIGICLLCDFVITRSFTWSLVATAAICYGCMILTPLLLAKRKIIELTLAVIMLMIYPFMLVISFYVPIPNFLEIAWILAIGSDVLIILCYLVLKKLRCSLWFKLAMIVLLSGMFNMMINIVTVNTFALTMLQLFVNLFAFVVLIIIGIYQKRRMCYE